MKKRSGILLITGCSLLLVVQMFFALPIAAAVKCVTGVAVGEDIGLCNTAKAGGVTFFNSANVPVFIGRIIQTVLKFVGVVAFVLFIYGGFLWMTARGDEGQVTKSKNLLVNAVIGLIIILSSYVLTNFVINSISEATDTAPATQPSSTTPSPAGGGDGG